MSSRRDRPHDSDSATIRDDVTSLGTGVGLMRARQAEAQARAEADRANREASTANRVTQFLVDLFTVTDPRNARGDTVTAREVLDRGAEKVRAELASEPIVQARLEHGSWAGWADVLLRVDGASQLGEWYYEPVETKLAKETRGATLMQLCLYAELLAELQGTSPAVLRVVVPERDFVPQCYRFDEFRAYFRFVRREFEVELQKPVADSVAAAEPYPTFSLFSVPLLERSSMSIAPACGDALTKRSVKNPATGTVNTSDPGCTCNSAKSPSVGML